MDVEPFALSATLAGHEQDVRAVSASADNTILTASRDSSVRVWSKAEADGPYAPTSLLGHTHYVIAVATSSSGAAASGSNDKHVIEWDLAAGMPARVLEGHTNTVSCVTYSEAGGTLLSASWDSTAKVWKDGDCVHTLKGHEATVWAVLPLEDAEGHILTASGDRTIKLWAGERCVRTYTGHADAVRSLAHVSGIGFLSASNDGTVRLWELGGTCLHVQHASESFVYSVAVLPTGEWMTSSEDRTVKIWPSGGGECVQSMTHPANVWACAALPNGDIVAGCADGNAYVWTRAPARAAAEAEQLAFKETVASVALPAQQVASDLGALEKDIKGEDALNTPGTREGQTLIVRDPASKTPMLYQWSMASATWEKVGEVVGGKDDGGSGATLGKRMFEGKEYDYLFDIDINGMPLKLPFNSGDDPWMTAQQWIWKNDIDQMHLDAVAKHLIDNTPGNTPNVGYGNVDPFTSGGAYQPGAGGSQTGGGGGNVDPFTSGGAYRPGPPSGAGSGGFEDPLSAKRYRPGNAGAPAAAPAAPSAAFATFDTCKHDAVLGKLLQFNTQLAAEGGAAALDEATSARLTALVGVLKASGSKVSKEDLELFLGSGSAGGLLSWPTAYLFPPLDLLRLVVLQPPAAAHVAAAQPPVLPRLIALLTSCQAAEAGDKPAAAAVLMLLRTFANMASRRELRALVATSASELLDTLHAPLEAGPTAARLAACTLLMNLTSLLHSGGELPPEVALKSDACALQALSLVAFALSSVPVMTTPAEEESLHRVLVALGALVGGGSAASSAADTARDLDIPSALAALALPSTASPLVVAARDRCVAALKK